jgi:hypothetical protein
MKKQRIMIGLSILVLSGMGSSAYADLIKPTVRAFSSELTAYGRQAVHSCDASGLTGLGNLGDPHTNIEGNYMWTTVGNIGPGTDYDPYITYDLGAYYDVTVIREWGYNFSTPFGPSNIVVYTSQDGITFTNAGTVTFAKAPGTAGYGGHDIAVNYPGVRYIKLDIMTSWDGAVFDGTGTIRGANNRALTGLSEIRFEGTKYGGTLITPLVNAVSSELTSANRQAFHSCDSSGLTGIGNQGDPHNTSENDVVWTTVGTNVVTGSIDFDPYITYDLGGIYNVKLIREWGYNTGLQVGPSNVVVYTSQDGNTFTNAGSVTFAKAPNNASYGGNEIAVNYPAVRFIKLDIMTSWNGAVFDGTGTVRGVDGRALTGLSEIRFVGTRLSPWVFTGGSYDGFSNQLLAGATIPPYKKGSMVSFF